MQVSPFDLYNLTPRQDHGKFVMEVSVLWRGWVEPRWISNCFMELVRANLQLLCITLAPLTLVELLQIPQNIQEAAEELEFTV